MMKIIWKEAHMVPYRHSHGRTEEDNENSVRIAGLRAEI
jgi:hypothetical protein